MIYIVSLETAAIFFSSGTWFKTGYLISVCHGWFHLHGLTRHVRSPSRELQNEKFLPTVGFEPGTFRLRSELAMRWAISWAIYRALKFSLRFTWACFWNYLNHVVDVAKWNVVYFHVIKYLYRFAVSVFD